MSVWVVVMPVVVVSLLGVSLAGVVRAVGFVDLDDDIVVATSIVVAIVHVTDAVCSVVDIVVVTTGTI